jgi:preprotein translocase subunit SecG
MSTFFGILAILAAILLILIVVVQNSKGGGLSGALGASNITNMIGTRRATQDIEKYTWYLVACMMFLAFLANVTTDGKTESSATSFEKLLDAPNIPQQAVPAEQATEAPVEE